MFRSIYRIFICLAFLTFFGPVIHSALAIPPVTPPVNQAGRISNCTQLKGIVRGLSMSYSLTADIDCTGISFTAIGTPAAPFVGQIKGQGHKISNVTIGSHKTFTTDDIFVSSKSAIFTNLTITNFKANLKLPFRTIEASGFGHNSFARILSMSGNYLAVSDPFDSAYGINSGMVYMFHRAGNVWKVTDTLYALSPQPLDYFGGGVVLQGDRMFITNGTWDSPLGIFVFQLKNGHWIQQTVIPLVNPLRIAADGDTLAAITPDHKVQIYQWNGSQWIMGQTIESPQEAIDGDKIFATSLAIQGNYLIVGAPANFPRDFDKRGMAIVYTKQNGAWQKTKIVDGFSPGFGDTVALDGGTAAAAGDEGIYVFDPSTGIPVLIANQTQYKDSFVGRIITIHNNVLGFNLSPGYYGNTLPPEKVVFYKKMADNQWHLLDEIANGVDPLFVSDQNAVLVSGFGWSIEFDDQDIFIGEPSGVEYPFRGKLHLLSPVDSIQSPPSTG